MAGALKRCIEKDSTVATSISCMLASSLSLRGYCGSRMGRGKDLWGSYEALFVAPLVVSNTAKPALALPFFQLHWIGYDFATHNKHRLLFFLLLALAFTYHWPFLGLWVAQPQTLSWRPTGDFPDPLSGKFIELGKTLQHKYLSTWRNWKPLPGFSPCPATRDLSLFLGGPTGPTPPASSSSGDPGRSSQTRYPANHPAQLPPHHSHLDQSSNPPNPFPFWLVDTIKPTEPLFLSARRLLSALLDLDFHSSPELSKTPHENSET